MFSEEVIKLAKSVVEAIKKISKLKWKWEPEVGEWWRLNDYVWLIKDDSDVEHCQSFPPPNVVVPLLHWERIEPILEGMGWSKFKFSFWNDGEVEACSRKTMSKPDTSDWIKVCYATAKSRQLAVMRAVIELGKEY